MIVDAEKVTREAEGKLMVFRDSKGSKVAFIPIDRTLYITKSDD